MTSKKINLPLIVSLIGTIVMAVITVLTSAHNGWTSGQVWVMVVISAVGAFNVWAAANLPGYTNIKKYVAIATVVLQALFVFIVGGITGAEWINLLVTLLTAVGVAVVPHPITTTQTTGTAPAPGQPAVGGPAVTVVQPAQ